MRALEDCVVDEDKPSRDFATWAGALEEFGIWTPQDDTLVATGKRNTQHSAWIGGSGYFNFASKGNTKVPARTPSGPSLTDSEPNAAETVAASMKQNELPEALAKVIAHQDAMIENLLTRCQALEAQAAQASLPPQRQTTSHINRTNQQNYNRRLADSNTRNASNTRGTSNIRNSNNIRNTRNTSKANRTSSANVVVHQNGGSREQVRRALIRDGAGRHNTAVTTTPSKSKRVLSPTYLSPGSAAPNLAGSSGTQRQNSLPRSPRVADPTTFARNSTPSPSPARHDVAHRSPSTSARNREGSRGPSLTTSAPTGGSPLKLSVSPSWSPRRGGGPGTQRCRGQWTQPQPTSRQQQDDEPATSRMLEYRSTLAASPPASADLTGGTGECMFIETAEPGVMTSSNALNARRTDTTSICRRSMNRFKGVEPTRTKQGKAASQSSIKIP